MEPSFLDTLLGRRYHRNTLSGERQEYQPLAVESIQTTLGKSPVGHNIIYLSSVTSTMDAAREQAERGAEEGTVVVAEEQTVGRGRFGRRWVSNAGQDLLFSVLLYPSGWVFSRLSLAVPVAVVRAIRRTCGISPALKWPNDVRIGDKKVSGILVESAVRGAQIHHAIAGIGINVNMEPDRHPEAGPGITSLAAELGGPVSRDDLLLATLAELGRIYNHLRGWDDVQGEWMTSLETLGRQVQVRWGEQLEEGVAEGVDAEGNLLLRRADGSLITLTAGEVTLQV
jgi:BirA family biotin operon repressor/biotin-[acetyl-CoA-carboxylase] ligase